MWNWFVKNMMAVGQSRDPDFAVGGVENPYLRRWFVIPRNRFFNIYLHQFLRDDDDRALHDHPWAWCSILLQGMYREHTADRPVRLRIAPSLKFSGPRRAHRIELMSAFWAENDFDLACDIHRERPADKAPCWTLFITSPRVRTWGFHCPKGWVPWQEFTNPEDGGATVGRGCGESE